MATDIGPWLGRKYQIQQQQADTATSEANARNNLTNVQASLLPKETNARTALDFSQGNAANATANLSNANAAEVPGLAGSERAQRIGTANLSNAQAAGVNFENTPDQVLSQYTQRTAAARNSPLSLPGTGLDALGLPDFHGNVTPNPTLTGTSGQINTPQQQDTSQSGGSTTPRYRWDGQNFVDNHAPQQFHTGTSMVDEQGNTPMYSSGTDKVPGKGSGKVDKVPAVLAPGEAVLNKAAAEHLGKSTIDLLNALGMQKMGMAGPQTTEDSRAQEQQPDQSSGAGQSQGTTQGYAKGTSNAGATRGATAGEGYAKGTGKVPAKGAKPPAKAAGGKGGKEAPGGHVAVSPHLLAALMNMGQQGGGMPQGNAQPMPMPMPPVAPQQ